MMPMMVAGFWEVVERSAPFVRIVVWRSIGLALTHMQCTLN